MTVADEPCAVVPLRFHDDDLRQALDAAAILAHAREHDNAGDVRAAGARLRSWAITPRYVTRLPARFASQPVVDDGVLLTI